MPSSRALKASSRSLNGTTSAAILALARASVTRLSVVVPATTESFLPARSAAFFTPPSARTSKAPVWRKVTVLKSTFSWRLSVLVVTPHSMSALPSATIARRSGVVPATQLIFSASSPSCRWICATMPSQRLIEKPAGLKVLVSSKENGAAFCA